MQLLKELKKIAVKIEKDNNAVLNYPINKQKDYIRHFKKPKNDLERSYFQYRCQMKMNNRIIIIIQNLAALPLLIYYLLKRESEDNESAKSQYDAVFFSEGLSESVVPEALRKEFDRFIIIANHKELLNKEDKAFFWEIAKNYPLSWLFLLKILIKVRFYSYAISKYHPKAICVCNEYSFTSSILTLYCERRNVEHIDLMHGEKLFFMRDSFFHFHRCYVWDQYYISLFDSLRANCDDYYVSVPKSLEFDCFENCEKHSDYTYYLAAEKGERLVNVINNLELLSNKGKKVVVRPHPRYSDLDEIKALSINIEIELPNEVEISKSIMRTEKVISLYSTVLNQAHHNHIDIVIDDVSDPKAFNDLKERQYIMLNVEHELLSDLL